MLARRRDGSAGKGGDAAWGGKALLTAAGYTIADRWGSFRFGPYDAATSDLRILAAQPPR